MLPIAGGKGKERKEEGRETRLHMNASVPPCGGRQTMRQWQEQVGVAGERVEERGKG